MDREKNKMAHHKNHMVLAPTVLAFSMLAFVCSHILCFHGNEIAKAIDLNTCITTFAHPLIGTAPYIVLTQVYQTATHR